MVKKKLKIILLIVMSIIITQLTLVFSVVTISFLLTRTASYVMYSDYEKMIVGDKYVIWDEERYIYNEDFSMSAECVNYEGLTLIGYKPTYFMDVDLFSNIEYRTSVKLSDKIIVCSRYSWITKKPILRKSFYLREDIDFNDINISLFKLDYGPFKEYSSNGGIKFDYSVSLGSLFTVETGISSNNKYVGILYGMLEKDFFVCFYLYRDYNDYLIAIGDNRSHYYKLSSDFGEMIDDEILNNSD